MTRILLSVSIITLWKSITFNLDPYPEFLLTVKLYELVLLAVLEDYYNTLYCIQPDCYKSSENSPRFQKC